MPVVALNINRIRKLVSGNTTRKQILDVLPFLGLDIESEDGDKIRAIIYSGDQAANDKKAGDIAKIVSEILGGAGGGNQRFAQGGGKDKSKKNDAIEKVKSMVLEV